MTTADWIVLLIVSLTTAIAFYEGFIRHRKEACYGCPYAENCSSSCKKGNKKNKNL